MGTRSRSAIALVVACTSIAAAQSPAVPGTSTDIVFLPVSVTDGNGRFVRGLPSHDFQIADDGIRRDARRFSAERVPMSLALLLDISGSLAQDPDARAADDARWAETRRGIEVLLTRLDADDEVLFAVFNEQAKASLWTQEHRSILGTFDLLYRGGGAAVLDSVKRIASVLQTARHQRKVILLISDGNDTQTPAGDRVPSLPYEIGSRIENTMGEARRNLLHDLAIHASRDAVRKSDAQLYAIGMPTHSGVPVDLNLLNGLTKDSGGYTELLHSPSQIAAAVGRICDDLQSQYLLTFEPAHADGKYHRIRVRTKDSRLKVRARAGYVAASSGERARR